jgi:AcrR family transcriptional regulator
MATRGGATTRLRIIDAAYEQFYKEGFARSSIDVIAQAANVTKRTFYYHFDSKDALLAAVLDSQHGLIFTRIRRWAGQPSEGPVEAIGNLFRELARWAKRPGWKGSGFTRMAMELADLPGHPARAAVSRHKAAVESWLADQFALSGTHKARQIAQQMMLLIEGCHSLILIHGDTSYAKAAYAAARLLIKSQEDIRSG